MRDMSVARARLTPDRSRYHWCDRDIVPTVELASSLPFRAAHDLHQLFNFSALISLTARGNRTLHAMCDVVAQDLLFHTSERCAHRRNLRDDVDAIAILVDHPRDAAHLALDPAQSLGAQCLDVFSHAVYIPLEGISCKPEGTRSWLMPTPRRSRPAAVRQGPTTIRM